MNPVYLNNSEEPVKQKNKIMQQDVRKLPAHPSRQKKVISN
jgi:hypothetical protein